MAADMTVAELQVVLNARIDDFSKQINQVKTKLNEMTSHVNQKTAQMSSAFTKVGSAIKSSMRIAASLADIAGVAMASLIDESMEASSAANRLSVTMKNAADATDEEVEAIRSLTERYEQLGVVSATAQQAGAQELATYVESVGAIQKMIPVMNDMVAQQYGYNASAEQATTIATMLGKVLQGQTGALSRYGYSFDEAQEQLLKYGTEAQRVATLAQVVSQSVGGMNLALGNTPEGRIVQLRNNFGALRESLGSLLVNVLSPVISFLNAIISKVIMVINVINALVRAFFGIPQAISVGGASGGGAMDGIASGAGDAAKGVGDVGKAADKTKKKLGDLAGFDELNIIKAQNDSGSGGGGGGGAGGGGLGGLSDLGFDPNIFDSTPVDEFVDRIKAKMESLKAWFSENFPVISSLLAGLLAGFITFQTIMNWGKIVASIQPFIAAMQSVWTVVSGFFLGIIQGEGVLATLQGLFGSTAGTALFFSAIVAAVTAALVYLYQTSESFRVLVNEALLSVWDILQNLYTSVLQPIFTLLADIFSTVIVPIATFLAGVFVKTIELIASTILSLWNNILAPLVNFIVNVVGIALKGIIEIWNSGLKPTIVALGNSIKNVWDNYISPFVDKLINIACKKFEEWGDVIDKVIAAATTVIQGIVDFLVGVFLADTDKCLSAIGDIFKGLKDFLVTIFGPDSNRVFDSIRQVLDGLRVFVVGIFKGDMNTAWAGIRQIFQAFDSFLNGIFKTDWTYAFGDFGRILNGFCSTVSSIWNGIKTIFSGIITFVKGVFTGNWRQAWDGVVQIFSGIWQGITGVLRAPMNGIIGLVNGVVSRINGFGFDVPSWVPVIGGQSFRVNVPPIPYLAQGGIVNHQTLAMLAEGHQSEAIIPLKRNQAGIQKIANAITNNMSGLSNDDSKTYIFEIKLDDGEVLTRHVIKGIREYEAKTGQALFSY